jgi:hypothetical protein
VVPWSEFQAQGKGMVQAVTGHVEGSIRYDQTKNCVSVLALLSVYHSLEATQIDGTARSSMLSDLIERNTDKDGRIDSEEDIAACVAVAYAGMSFTCYVFSFCNSSHTILIQAVLIR